MYTCARTAPRFFFAFSGQIPVELGDMESRPGKGPGGEEGGENGEGEHEGESIRAGQKYSGKLIDRVADI